MASAYNLISSRVFKNCSKNLSWRYFIKIVCATLTLCKLQKRDEIESRKSLSSLTLYKFHRPNHPARNYTEKEKANPKRHSHIKKSQMLNINSLQIIFLGGILLYTAHLVIGILAYIKSNSSEPPTSIRHENGTLGTTDWQTWYMNLPVITIIFPNPGTSAIIAFRPDCKKYNNCDADYLFYYLLLFYVDLSLWLFVCCGSAIFGNRGEYTEEKEV